MSAKIARVNLPRQRKQDVQKKKCPGWAVTTAKSGSMCKSSQMSFPSLTSKNQKICPKRHVNNKVNINKPTGETTPRAPFPPDPIGALSRKSNTLIFLHAHELSVVFFFKITIISFKFHVFVLNPNNVFNAQCVFSTCKHKNSIEFHFFFGGF